MKGKREMGERMNDWGDGAEVTPSGYQGAARHTWTAGCDGLHGQCKADPPMEITGSGTLALPPLGALLKPQDAGRDE